METVECILCNINDTETLVQKDSFNIVKCRHCDLVYVNPRLTPDELVMLYNKGAETTNVQLEIDRGNNNHDRHKVKKFDIALSELGTADKVNNKVLDIGCSTGVFMEMAERQGWMAYGVDVNKEHIENNRTKFDVRVSVQQGDTLDFQDAFFDVVTLFDVIEHLPHPLPFLAEVKRVLKPDGVLILSTPNVDGFFPKITYFLLGRTIGAWEHPTPPGHVFQFSRDTLRQVVKRAGFDVKRYRDFEIHPTYTVYELENSITKAIRKKIDQAEQPNVSTPVPDVGNVNVESTSSTGLHFSIKKLPRLVVRAFSWLLVVAIYPLARWRGRGDSMIMVAKAASINENR